MRARAIEITPMHLSDLDEVLAIEQSSYRSPWPSQVFTEELAREWAYLEVVRERGVGGSSRVVGFCNYWLVRDEVHLLNLAIAQDCRRHGYGTRLLEHMIEFAQRHQAIFITLEVRRSNEAAIKLYEHYEFVAVGLRPKYYVEDGEDAIIMTRALATAGA